MRSFRNISTKNEYDNLLTYFKFLVRMTVIFLTIIGIVGGFFIYNSLSDIKADMRQISDMAKTSI